MPEFILDMGDNVAARRFNKLSPFVQGYIEALFFTDTGDRDDDGLENASFAELSRASIARIKAECGAWQHANAGLLALAYASDDYDEEQAGRDYWFTRNGHGVGFWAREQLTKVVCGVSNETNLGDVLSERARHSSRSIYRGDDKRIHYTTG